MGLMANIPAIEAAHTLATAKAVAIALGDAKTLAHCVMLDTNNPRLAQNVEIQARMKQGLNV